MKNHDIHTTFVGVSTEEKKDEIREAMEALNFNGSITIEERVVNFFEATEEYPSHAMVFLNIEADNDVDYAMPRNADGLATDIAWQYQGSTDYSYEYCYDRTKVWRMNFCKHPSAENGTCGKCGGPVHS